MRLLLSLFTLALVGPAILAKDPLRFIPAETGAVFKIEKPRALIEAVTKHDLARQAQELQIVRDFLDGAGARRFFQLVAYYERDLGAAWPDLLDKLAGGGIAVGVNKFENGAPALVVIQGTDEATVTKFFDLALKVVEEEAERQEDLESLESREGALSTNLASISEQVAAEGGDATTGLMPAPLNPGQEAQVLSESEASAPASAPQAVQEVISAGNAIATTPYIWGGGHGSFESSGYDCSGAVSYALHGGGFLESPLDSTGLETWGEPGPGQWITVYANSGHAWMVVAGIAFDTVGGPGPRWHDPWVDSPEGFVARHPAGY